MDSSYKCLNFVSSRVGGSGWGSGLVFLFSPNGKTNQTSKVPFTGCTGYKKTLLFCGTAQSKSRSVISTHSSLSGKRKW